MRIVLRLLPVLAIFLAPLAVVPTPAQAESCKFVLGFKTIHDLIPDVVGSCLVNVHFNVQNGDSTLDSWTEDSPGPSG